MLLSADRIAFSGQIVGSVAAIKGIKLAQSQLQAQIGLFQNLDTANMNLFTSPNLLINAYQGELSALDGNGRTVIVEQDIQDAANKKFQNHFFPNDITTAVPSIISLHNVWPLIVPFALGFGIGKSYVETYTVVPKEIDSQSPISSQITAARAMYSDMELTTGESLGPGSCSLPEYTTQASCESAIPTPGVWTSGTVGPSPAIIAIKDNLVAAVVTYKAFLQAELALIPTTDKNPTNKANNIAAINNINNVIISALDIWIALADFEVLGIGPSKLHSTNLNTLLSALSARNSFTTIRIGQIAAALGNPSQDITTGVLTGTGIYVTRYNVLVLRLNLLGGSLSQLASARASSNAQTSIANNIAATASTYASIIPTTRLASPANGTNTISVVDSSQFSVGDTVFVVADSQDELQRAIKSITGKLITLNDVIPSKYTTENNVRMYKDLS